MTSMFYYAYSFNQPLFAWDVSNVTNMSWMFDHAHSFNQSLFAWDVSSVAVMYWMFYGVTLDTENYDALLKGWSRLPSLRSGVAFHAGNSKRSRSEDVTDAYNKLTTDGSEVEDTFQSGFRAWNITDGGQTDV